MCQCCLQPGAFSLQSVIASLPASKRRSRGDEGKAAAAVATKVGASLLHCLVIGSTSSVQISLPN